MYLIEVQTPHGAHSYHCAHYEVQPENMLLLISDPEDPQAIIATYREWDAVIEIESERRIEEGIL